MHFLFEVDMEFEILFYFREMFQSDHFVTVCQMMEAERLDIVYGLHNLWDHIFNTNFLTRNLLRNGKGEIFNNKFVTKCLRRTF